MTATQWLETLLSYSLQVVIVVATCRLLERAVPGTDDRCRIWNHCFLCVLILGCAAVLFPRLHFVQPWATLEPRTLLEVSSVQAVLGEALLAIWSIGSLASLVRWAQRSQSLRRVLQRCTRVADEEVAAWLRVADCEIEQPLVLVSDEVDSPFCWQFHRPMIVLPRYLLEGSGEDLQYVLIHERAHLETHHPFQLFLQNLVQVVCWFHPAIWRAGGWASLSREFCCDEVAANHGADSAPYLRTLLRIAERCEKAPRVPSIGFGSAPSEIVLRARRLVELAKGASRPATGLTGPLGRKTAAAILLVVTCTVWFLAIPSDPLASTRSAWSPWPSWTAKSAYCFGFELRDYEQYDRRTQVYEMIQDARGEAAETTGSAASATAK